MFITTQFTLRGGEHKVGHFISPGDLGGLPEGGRGKAEPKSSETSIGLKWDSVL